MNSEKQVSLLNFVRHLMTAVANATLYSVEHQQVERLNDAAHAELRECLGEDDEFVLMIVDDQLIVSGSPQQGNLYVGRFIAAFRARSIGHVTFEQGVTRDELAILVAGLAGPATTALNLGDVHHIHVGRIDVSNTDFKDGVASDDVQKIPSFSDIARDELARFLEIYERVKKDKKLNVSGIYDIVTNFVRAFKQEAGAIMAFAPLRALDEYTFTHSTNVCILNLAQAMALGIDGPLLHDIGVAAMLHDIGKLFIPDEIINKPDKLTDDEWQLIKQHPVKGAQHLLDTPGVPHLAVVTAYEHHMKFNGTGYPASPADWRQNLCSQMTAVSDCFDALRTKRSYRVALDWHEVSGIILGLAGTDLHPVLAKNLIRILAKLEHQDILPGH